MTAAPDTTLPEAVAGARMAEILSAIKKWGAWAGQWAGTAFLADEALPLDAMTDREHKSELYSGLCKLMNVMAWLHDEVSALSHPAALSGGEAVPVAITEAMAHKAMWAYEREITKAVDGGLNSESFGEALTTAIRAALTAALATAPEGSAKNLRQIVFDALDLSDELRNECADAVVAALTGSSHP